MKNWTTFFLLALCVVFVSCEDKSEWSSLVTQKAEVAYKKIFVFDTNQNNWRKLSPREIYTVGEKMTVIFENKKRKFLGYADTDTLTFFEIADYRFVNLELTGFDSIVPCVTCREKSGLYWQCESSTRTLIFSALESVDFEFTDLRLVQLENYKLQFWENSKLVKEKHYTADDFNCKCVNIEYPDTMIAGRKQKLIGECDSGKTRLVPLGLKRCCMQGSGCGNR